MLSKIFAAAAVAALSALSMAALAALSGAPSLNKPVTQLNYSGTGITDGIHGEVKTAPAYGDPTLGAHGTFLKMPGGFVSPAHTHSSDYWAVVISGIAANGPPGSTDVPLPVGSYWYQKGGEVHVTKCLTPNECLFFISQQAPFDFIPSKDHQ
jgi:beta-alanine degradation protein BauB